MSSAWGDTWGDAWGNAWGTIAAPVIPLVDSPTRLSRMRLRAKTGDAVVIREILLGPDRVVQDLTGAMVRFTLTSPDGSTKIVDRAAATIVDAVAGSVSYTIPATVELPTGVCNFEFEVTWDAEMILTFPDDSNGELVVVAQLG